MRISTSAWTQRAFYAKRYFVQPTDQTVLLENSIIGTFRKLGINEIMKVSFHKKYFLLFNILLRSFHKHLTEIGY